MSTASVAEVAYPWTSCDGHGTPAPRDATANSALSAFYAFRSDRHMYRNEGLRFGDGVAAYGTPFVLFACAILLVMVGRLARSLWRMRVANTLPLQLPDLSMQEAEKKPVTPQSATSTTSGGSNSRSSRTFSLSGMASMLSLGVSVTEDRRRLFLTLSGRANVVFATCALAAAVTVVAFGVVADHHADAALCKGRSILDTVFDGLPASTSASASASASASSSASSSDVVLTASAVASSEWLGLEDIKAMLSSTPAITALLPELQTFTKQLNATAVSLMQMRLDLNAVDINDPLNGQPLCGGCASWASMCNSTATLLASAVVSLGQTSKQLKPIAKSVNTATSDYLSFVSSAEGTRNDIGYAFDAIDHYKPAAVIGATVLLCLACVATLCTLFAAVRNVWLRKDLSRRAEAAAYVLWGITAIGAVLFTGALVCVGIIVADGCTLLSSLHSQKSISQSPQWLYYGDTAVSVLQTCMDGSGNVLTAVGVDDTTVGTFAAQKHIFVELDAYFKNVTFNFDDFDVLQKQLLTLQTLLVTDTGSTSNSTSQVSSAAKNSTRRLSEVNLDGVSLHRRRELFGLSSFPDPSSIPELPSVPFILPASKNPINIKIRAAKASSQAVKANIVEMRTQLLQLQAAVVAAVDAAAPLLAAVDLQSAKTSAAPSASATSSSRASSRRMLATSSTAASVQYQTHGLSCSFARNGLASADQSLCNDFVSTYSATILLGFVVLVMSLSLFVSYSLRPAAKRAAVAADVTASLHPQPVSVVA